MHKREPPGEMQITNYEKREDGNETQAQVAKSKTVGDESTNGCSEGKLISPMDLERNINRFSNDSAIKSSTQSAIRFYQEIEWILESNKYKDLRKNLESSFPKYFSLFHKWRKDLEKTDHGIVVAGQTSSGKSTLINKIMGIKLFKGRLAESTSTVCKIRNSDQIRIIATKNTGEILETNFPNKCNLQQKKDIRELRRVLKECTDHKYTSSDIGFQTVDIGLPVPFLKGNTVLVDTPGIGGSGNVTHKLIEYLPNALALIFVVDVSSAAGMQKDRLPEILKKITSLKDEMEMPCFSPENVVFITNKWDLVRKQIDNSEEDSSESDNEEEIGIWKQLKMDIKQEWPYVGEENIFKMILKDVSSHMLNDSTTSFKEFQKTLASLVKKAENLRLAEHLGFLQHILKKMSEGIEITKEMLGKSKEELYKKYGENEEKIASLKHKQKQVEEKYKNEVVEMNVSCIIDECLEFMSTNDGKHKILNPPGRVSIADTNWKKTDVQKRIKSRTDLHVKSFLLSDAVVKRKQNILREMQSLAGQSSSYNIKTEHYSVDINPKSDEETESLIYYFNLQRFDLFKYPAYGAIIAPAYFFFLPVGLLLYIVLVVFGYLYPVPIDVEYENCKRKCKPILRNHLKKLFTEPIKEMRSVVSNDLHRCLKEKEERKIEISEKRKKVRANCYFLDELPGKLNALEEAVTLLQTS